MLTAVRNLGASRAEKAACCLHLPQKKSTAFLTLCTAACYEYFTTDTLARCQTGPPKPQRFCLAVYSGELTCCRDVWVLAPHHVARCPGNPLWGNAASAVR